MSTPYPVHCIATLKPEKLFIANFLDCHFLCICIQNVHLRAVYVNELYMLPSEWIFQPKPFRLAQISPDPRMNTNI